MIVMDCQSGYSYHQQDKQILGGFDIDIDNDIAHIKHHYDIDIGYINVSVLFLVHLGIIHNIVQSLTKVAYFLALTCEVVIELYSSQILACFGTFNCTARDV